MIGEDDGMQPCACRIHHQVFLEKFATKVRLRWLLVQALQCVYLSDCQLDKMEGCGQRFYEDSLGNHDDTELSSFKFSMYAKLAKTTFHKVRSTFENRIGQTRFFDTR